MKAIDMQSILMSKEKGPAFRDPRLLSELTAYFRSPDEVMKSEKEMIQDLRNFDVKLVLVSGGWRLMGWEDFGEIREINNYLGELKRKYPKEILGFWVAVDPDRGREALRELERCIKNLGSFGVAACGAIAGVPANDKQWYPFYELCLEAKVPLKIWVGHIAIRGRVPLWTENPIPYVDDVAWKFPELTIICAHHPWPFHHEMTSVLIHHPNVYNEQHGWSPKYFPEEFKKEINTRIADKVMFGSDYPLFSYERLFKDWEAQNFKPEVLEKVYWKNAQGVLESLGIKV